MDRGVFCAFAYDVCIDSIDSIDMVSAARAAVMATVIVRIDVGMIVNCVIGFMFDVSGDFLYLILATF